jgi:glycolate oxidase
MNATPALSPDTLFSQLVAALGAAAVSQEPARLEHMGTDVYHAGGRPAAVVRPTSVAALQAAVKVCAAAGVAMVPRSGGASYTDGYLYAPGGHVLFDCGGLDQIEVDVPNAVVTCGPGVSWAALRTRLAEVGLRTPFWGPRSATAAAPTATRRRRCCRWTSCSPRANC